jgi:DNA-binding SARP family transcriptional activator/predicted ATPase
VLLDERPVTEFKSNKVRALLAYLAVEADRPHRREVLAGLLWSEWPDREALSNLRYALSSLRRAIGDRDADPEFLLVTRDSLQLNTASDFWLDVAAFTDAVQGGRTQSPATDQLEQAIAIYRGSFLEGFSVGDSPAFEEWAILTRERLARLMSSSLHRLAERYQHLGAYEHAEHHARRQTELEPWDEQAHQQLMRALALGGQRATALAQYETCRRLLSEELGVEPSRETTRLYEQIRDGELQATAPARASQLDLAPGLPRFLDEEAPEVEPTTFVARERELMQMHDYLDLVLAGQGLPVFLTGEAGSGKTALIQEFTRRAQDASASSSQGSGQNLVVAIGNCNAYTGLGDPYLPFREILELLTGDVEAQWAAGSMTREQAQQLWSLLPPAVQALVEGGPDLIDTFVLRAALLSRARAIAPNGAGWLTRLEELLEHKPASTKAPMHQQDHLFKQYTGVLRTLARQVPMVLVVDDLQWADAGSISLLFHLGRQLAGSRILLVGAYRPEEIALGRDGERHPLEPVVNELQRNSGLAIVDLGQADRQGFVEALLDSEPNRLGPSFRQKLVRQTQGHPLFTVELLRGMQERDDLIQDGHGRIIEGPALDWETLPARVEAAIKERIGRLDQMLRSALQVASVEGEVFTAEVVARVQAVSERELVGRLSGELDRRHQLVRAHAIEHMGSQRLSRYRFRNYLFQKYLYDSLDNVERTYLHEDVANALEGLYRDRASETAGAAAIPAIAVQLARHFQEAGVAEKAIHYLHQAGERAIQLSAYQEGKAHLSAALALVETLPDTAQRAQRELALLASLRVLLANTLSLASPEAGTALERAWELCQQLDDTPQRFSVMLMLGIRQGTQGEYQAARETLENVFDLAELAERPWDIAVAHHAMGWLLAGLGEFTSALEHARRAVDLYAPQPHDSVAVHIGIDPGVQCRTTAARTLWFLGYPEQALEMAQEALARAGELVHTYSLADALSTGGAMVHLFLGALDIAQAQAEASLALASEYEFRGFVEQATMQLGRVLVRQGRIDEGIAQLRQGLEAWETTGAWYRRSLFLAWLAEALGQAGQPGEGLSVLDEALAQVEKTRGRCYEAELHRLKGELLLKVSDEAGAEASFNEALSVARRQQAKSWELRATTSLARLWQTQGKQDQARVTLAEIYDWFTEGFDTADLMEAKALLDELV